MDFDCSSTVPHLHKKKLTLLSFVFLSTIVDLQCHFCLQLLPSAKHYSSHAALSLPLSFICTHIWPFQPPLSSPLIFSTHHFLLPTSVPAPRPSKHPIISHHPPLFLLCLAAHHSPPTITVIFASPPPPPALQPRHHLTPPQSAPSPPLALPCHHERGHRHGSTSQETIITVAFDMV